MLVRKAGRRSGYLIREDRAQSTGVTDPAARSNRLPKPPEGMVVLDRFIGFNEQEWQTLVRRVADLLLLATSLWLLLAAVLLASSWTTVSLLVVLLLKLSGRP